MTIEVIVRNGNVINILMRVLKKKLLKDTYMMRELKERQYYQ